MKGKTDIPVYLSRLAEGVQAKDAHLQIGERLLYRDRVEVTIDSELMTHSSCPNYGYECVFADTGERAFADSERLEWLRKERR